MRYQGDLDWSLKMQPIAIRDYYLKAWPGSEVVELDMDRADSLKTAIDIGGADKMLRHPDGSVAFLAQRFRRAEYAKYDDFTLREARPSGHTTELGKMQQALSGGGFIAGYYSYGHANEAEDGFDRFRIFDYRRFAEMYTSGELPQGRRQYNRDGSATFLAWEFCTWPDKLFVLNERTP